MSYDYLLLHGGERNAFSVRSIQSTLQEYQAFLNLSGFSNMWELNCWLHKLSDITFAIVILPVSDGQESGLMFGEYFYPFQASVWLLYSLEILKNLCFSDVFR